MIIGITGYGYTGSGVVSDLLKEYDGIQVQDEFEFTLAFWPDGISDLEFHLMESPDRFFSSDLAIMRFKKLISKEQKSPNGWYKVATKNKFYDLSIEYLESITQIKWNGRWMIDPFLCNEFVRTIKYRLMNRISNRFHYLSRMKERFLRREMCFSTRPENFIEKTQMFFERILDSMGYDLTLPIALDQPFPGNNPIRCMRYFKNSKAIILTKDPRDLYILMKRLDVAWAPLESVDNFIVYYRKLLSPRFIRDDILYIQVEDLIYKYDETIKIIENFCDLKPDQHTNKFKYFNPQKSISNTQLFNYFTEYSSEISKIERELTSFLYDFSRFDISIQRTEVF